MSLQSERLVDDRSDLDAVALEEEARDALLRSIKSQANMARSSLDLLYLAEAWAWMVKPGQPHGASPNAPK